MLGPVPGVSPLLRGTCMSSSYINGNSCLPPGQESQLGGDGRTVVCQRPSCRRIRKTILLQKWILDINSIFSSRDQLITPNHLVLHARVCGSLKDFQQTVP